MMDRARARPANVRRPITIYCRWQDPGTKQTKPFRRVLRNCFFSEASNSVALRTGAIVKELLFLQCFLEPGMVYVPLHEWNKLTESELDGKWTVDDTEPQSIVVPYEIGFEFDWGTWGQATQAENIFLPATPGALRIQKVEPRLIGSVRSQHISLRA